jgi:1-acyl-sn-glycerol-3-phosphate acyltransferase
VLGYRILLLVLGPAIRRLWKLEVIGVEHLPAGACVVAPNHDSLSDPFFVGAALPRPLRMLGKKELFWFPLGALLRACGGIPVARGEGDGRAIASAVEALKGGEAVVIHPQGTTLGEADRPWKRGAARVAIESGAPIVPVALVDTERVLRPGTLRPHLARVTVVVGEPIHPGAARDPSEDDATELIGRVRAEVERLRAFHGTGPAASA